MKLNNGKLSRAGWIAEGEKKEGPSHLFLRNPESEATLSFHPPVGRGLSAAQPHAPVPIPVPQIGSYYGSEITSVDIDGDGVTDVLLVGAPMYFSEGGERGRVYIYNLRQVLSQGAGQLSRGTGPLP